MNINLTLIGQSIAFLLFVWFCMKFVWPPIVKALADRRQTIADGLAAAEKGRHERELGERRATEVIHEAKSKANEIITQAERRAVAVAEEAKAQAKIEAERIIAAARGEIDQEVNRSREQLRHTVTELAVGGASKILEREVDRKAHADLLASFVSRL
jgi:F-type H+-transporting ATPase subunit b